MALDPRIIMSGRQPDFVNAFSRGQQAGAQANQIRDQNAMRSMLRQQGPNIMAGEQNALNALAQFDPQAALGIQDKRLQMKQREQQLIQMKENAKLKAAQVAAGMSEQQREQERQTLERALAAGAAAQSPEEWDAAMIQFGAEDLVGGFEQRDMAFAAALGLKEALEMNASPEEPGSIRALRIRAREGGLEEGSEAWQEFMRRNGTTPQGMAIETTPGGGMRFAQGEGVGGGDFKFTEAQSKDNVFVTRAKGALEVFEPVADTLTSRQNRIAEGVPMGLARDYQDAEFQVAKQSGDEFLQAILRKDTGAAITEPEQELYGQTYLPQPGDGPEVLEAKRNARARAVDAIEAGMTPLQQVVVDRALVRGAERQRDRQGGGSAERAEAQQDTASDFQSMTTEQLVEVDETQLSDEELDAYLEALEAATGRR